MKKINKALVGVVSLFCLTACTDLDVPPLNIVNDKQILGSEGGVKSYMARVYGEMPIEDFRYSPEYLYNHFWVLRVPEDLQARLCAGSGTVPLPKTPWQTTQTPSAISTD